MNITNLHSDTDFLCGSTSATYPIADKIRNYNIEYHTVATVIWQSDGAWSFDDSNNTDQPIAYRTLGHASAIYQIPTTALRIDGVEVQDSGGNWMKLDPITYPELTQSPEEYLSSPGVPVKYLLEGNDIRVFPPVHSAHVTLTSGMVVRLNRDVTEFATTASTTTPGFAAPFHRILSYAAAIDFSQDSKQREFLIFQKDRLMKGLVSFYSKRGTQFPSRVKPKGKSRWRKYT